VGEKHYVNGDTFVGCWVQGKREGRGSYLYAEGHIYEGMYANDKAEGYGILSTLEGDRYAGWWRAGLKHGKGVETLHEGQHFVGSWVNGLKEGPGKLALPEAKSLVYGIWSRDHFTRELTEEERASWDVTEGSREMEGEGMGEGWDSEFEFNSSDEERLHSTEAGGGDGDAQRAVGHILSCSEAISDPEGILSPEASDGLAAMEERLDALQAAIEKAMKNSTVKEESL